MLRDVTAAQNQHVDRLKWRSHGSLAFREGIKFVGKRFAQRSVFWRSVRKEENFSSLQASPTQESPSSGGMNSQGLVEPLLATSSANIALEWRKLERNSSVSTKEKEKASLFSEEKRV